MSSAAALPPAFEESRPPTAAELGSLPAISREAVQVIERCIEIHHIADVDYVDAAGHRSTIRFQPAYIRHNTAEHVVVWGMPVGVDHWEELRLDRINGVRDSGEVFKPSW